MFGFNKKTTKSSENIVISDKSYKLNITYEKRRNSRVSITKSGINVRLDNRLSKATQTIQLDKFILWAKNTIAEKGHVFEVQKKLFSDSEDLCLYDKTLQLKIFETDKSRVSGKINNEQLLAYIPSFVSEENKQKYLSKLITRLLKKDYKIKIADKVNYFNQKFSLGEINTVRLKNNSTNWGSCSSKNNINISIRLLLAPEFALDYVIIHELCHLKHRNHSKHFWNLVKACCPEFEKAEKWLKLNANKCII